MAEEINEVYSLMIPTIDANILLPNASVAEVVPFMNVELFEEQGDKPSWFIGHLEWRGMKIPIVSIDVMNGADDAQANKRSRIAVVHAVTELREVPYVAIVVQGIPRLTHVTPDVVKMDEEADLGISDRAIVSVAGNKASIPDLDKLEELLSEQAA